MRGGGVRSLHKPKPSAFFLSHLLNIRFPTREPAFEMATPYNAPGARGSRSTPIATAASKAFQRAEVSPQQHASDELILVNRLAESRSPYVRTCARNEEGDGLCTTTLLVAASGVKANPVFLLQVRAHAGNPVHWQMWSPETLALAKKHNRVVFVSIGYAACHCKYPPGDIARASADLAML